MYKKISTVMNSLSYARFSNLAKSKWSTVIAFTWGFAEATVFFIVPDVFLGFVALFNWRRGLSAMLASLLGAILGGAVMYLLAMNNSLGVNIFLTRVPLIDAALVTDVANQTEARGLLAVLAGPLKGTPYKIYAAQAGEQSLPFIYFLLISILARGGRFLPVVLFFGGVGTRFKEFLEKRTTFVVGSYVLLWCIIYFVFIIYFGSH